MRRGERRLVELEEDRDFSKLFSAFLTFVKQNFLPLIKNYLFLGGPFLLGLALFESIYGDRIEAAISMAYTDNLFTGVSFSILDYLENIIPLYIAFIALDLISKGVLILINAQYLHEYLQTKSKPSSKAILKGLLGNITKILSVAFIYLFIYFLLFSGYLLVLGLAIQYNTGNSILTVFTFIGLLLIYFPIDYLVTSFFNIAVREKKGGFEAIKRGFFLLKKNYWRSWGVIFLIWLLLLVITLVIFTPFYIVSNAQDWFDVSKDLVSDWEIPILIVYLFCTFFSNLFNGFYYLIAGMHYYSLYEQKEGQGIMRRINAIGTHQNHLNSKE